MLTRQNLLVWWGLTVTVAYLLTEYFGHTMEHGHNAVLWTWSIAMIFPVGATLLLGGRANALAWVWAGATVLATAENAWVQFVGDKALMPFSFHTLWFVFGALGFAYTAAVVGGASRQRLYAGAAVLNLAGAVVMLLNHDLLKGYDFLILAAIQGVPMLLDVPLRRRHEAQRALAE